MGSTTPVWDVTIQDINEGGCVMTGMNMAVFTKDNVIAMLEGLGIFTDDGLQDWASEQGIDPDRIEFVFGAMASQPIHLKFCELVCPVQCP
jgi:hypothetical protein